jgi:hypothetical protein
MIPILESISIGLESQGIPESVQWAALSGLTLEMTDFEDLRHEQLQQLLRISGPPPSIMTKIIKTPAENVPFSALHENSWLRLPDHA